jgi:pyruvate, water dikinase
VVLINAAWGLGENVVQGVVDPDEYVVFKPLLDGRARPIIEKQLGGKARKMVYATGGGRSDAQRPHRCPSRARQLRALVRRRDRWSWRAGPSRSSSEHYGERPHGHGVGQGRRERRALHRPGPARDGALAQGGRARSRPTAQGAGPVLSRGWRSASQIGAGPVCRLDHASRDRPLQPGSVLVTAMTDPDWVPIMKKAGGIVTDRGGRTCHAAIVSRELGLPAWWAPATPPRCCTTGSR